MQKTEKIVVKADSTVLSFGLAASMRDEIDAAVDQFREDLLAYRSGKSGPAAPRSVFIRLALRHFLAHIERTGSLN